MFEHGSQRAIQQSISAYGGEVMSKTKISNEKRIQIFNRDGNKCLWCGRSVVDGIKLNADHIVPEHFGGSSDFDNLGTLCSLCNNGKGAEYYGNYLLSTMLKVPNIWSRIITIPKIDPCIGTWYRVSLNYYKFDGYGWQEDKIRQEYFIEDTLLLFKDKRSTNAEIQIREIEKKALLKFKDIVKNFLFENNGFFELSGDKLIFKRFKEK